MLITVYRISKHSEILAKIICCPQKLLHNPFGSTSQGSSCYSSSVARMWREVQLVHWYKYLNKFWMPVTSSQTESPQDE